MPKIQIKQTSPSQCRDLIDRWPIKPSEESRLVILDVRTFGEYASGHIKDSINLDFKSSSFRDQVSRLDRNRTYIVCCRTGVRSGQALMLMMALGFPELYNLNGGINAWKSEGFECISD